MGSGRLTLSYGNGAPGGWASQGML